MKTSLKALLPLLLLLGLPAVVQAQFTFTTNSGTITITGYPGPGGDVTIPSWTNGYRVTSIGDWAFYATSVTNVVIPDTVTSIADGAFFDCGSLTSVNISANLTNMGDWTFAFCSGLTSACFRGNAPSLGGPDVFYGCGATVYYLPGGTGWGSMFGGRPAALWSPPVPGQVIVWGFNQGGVLYVPPSATNTIALAAGDRHCLALRADGTVVAWGANFIGETNVPSGLTNVVSIAAGSMHSVALRSDGTVALWGHILGTAYPSTVPQEATNIVALGLGPGAQHVLALKSDGSLLDWGNTIYGSDIIPSAAQHIVAVAAGDYYGLALRGDGNVVAWGGTDPNTIPASATNVVAIATGWDGNAALCADGTVLTWGEIWSPSPTYGFNDAIDLAVPFNTSYPAASLLALLGDGTVVQSPVAGPSYATNVVAIAAGSFDGLAIVGNGPPVFRGLPVNRTVVPGRTAYLRMPALGALPICYQWSCNGTNIPGATNCVLIQPNVQPEQDGSFYSVTASNAFGLATSGLINLHVVPLEAAIQPQSISALPGTNVVFNADVFGPGSFGYQWQFNGTNIYGATNVTLLLPYVQFGQSGAYSVLVSNSYGVVTSSCAGLSVVPLMITTQPQSQTVPSATNVTFSEAATGQQPFSYQWQRNGTNLLNATATSLPLTSVQFTDAGSYSVIITNLSGAVTSAPAVLTVVPLLISTQPQAQTVPVGNNATFSVAATGQAPFSYQWLWNGTNLVSATNASLLLTNVQFAQTGSYWAVITNVYGAVTSSSAPLSVVPQLITNQPQPQVVLAGSNVVLSVGVAALTPVSCQWLLNGTNLPGAVSSSLGLPNIQFNQAGTYSVVISNSSGAVSSLGAALTVIPLLITTQPLNQTVTLGANATFSVAASSLVPLSYQWLCNGTNVPNATNASLVVTSVVMGQDGTYSVMVSNSYGSMTSWGAALNVLPLTIRTQPRNVTANAGDSAEFDVYASGRGLLHYQWRFNGTDQSGKTLTSLFLPSVQMSNAGTYCVVVTNAYGAVTSSPAVLTVTPLWLSSQPQSTTGLLGGTVTFSVTAGGQQPISYQWYCNGITLRDATNSSLALTNLQKTNVGTYFAVVSDPYATIPSATAQFFVNPISITSPLQDQVLFPGATTTLGVTAQSTQPINYQWQLNGTNLIGAVTNSLTFTNLQYNQAGLYTVVLSNMLGTTASAASLAVVPVAAWGDNSYGQTNIPSSLSNAVAVAGGYVHSLALRADGTVVAWGDNSHGQTNIPAGLSNVVAIASGSYHNLVLRSDGTVVAWGDNSYGQTNIPPGLSNVAAVAAGAGWVGGGCNLILRADGSLVAWGDNTFGQTNIPSGLSNVVAVAAGAMDNLALRGDGTVVPWGDNTYGQTNIPSGLGRVVAVSAGCGYYAVARADSTVVAWGDNTYDQTNTPSGLSNVVAIASGCFQSLALRADGGVVEWGNSGETNVPSGLSNVIKVAGGGYHSLALVGDQPPATQVMVSSFTKNASGFSLSIPTQSGRVYALEYKNSLSHANWVSLPLVAGTGPI